MQLPTLPDNSLRALIHRAGHECGQQLPHDPRIARVTAVVPVANESPSRTYIASELVLFLTAKFHVGALPVFNICARTRMKTLVLAGTASE